MVLELELGHFLDNIVVSMLRIHYQPIRTNSYLLRRQLILIIVFIARREPVRVVRRIAVAAVVIVVVRGVSGILLLTAIVGNRINFFSC